MVDAEPMIVSAAPMRTCTTASRPGPPADARGTRSSARSLAQLLRHAGATRVTVAAPTAAKLEIAARHGADETVQLDRADPGAGDEPRRGTAAARGDVLVQRSVSVPGTAGPR